MAVATQVVDTQAVDGNREVEVVIQVAMAAGTAGIRLAHTHTILSKCNFVHTKSNKRTKLNQKYTKNCLFLFLRCDFFFQ